MVMEISPATQTMVGKLEGGLAVHLENNTVMMTQMGSEFRMLIQVPPKSMNIHLFSASRSNPTSMEFF